MIKTDKALRQIKSESLSLLQILLTWWQFFNSKYSESLSPYLKKPFAKKEGNIEIQLKRIHNKSKS